MKYYKILYRKFTVAVFSSKRMAEKYIKDNEFMNYTLQEFEGDIYTLHNLGE